MKVFATILIIFVIRDVYSLAAKNNATVTSEKPPTKKPVVAAPNNSTEAGEIPF